MNRDSKLIAEAYQSIYSNNNLELLEELNNNPQLKPWAEDLCRRTPDQIVATLRELKNSGGFEDFRLKLEFLTHGDYEGKEQFLTKTVPAIKQVLGVRTPVSRINNDDVEHKAAQDYLLKKTDKS